MTAVPLGRAEIEAILPHRPPFLLLDEVLELEPGARVVARKTVREEDCAGHFPGNPIMPGVLQLEAMAQVASIVLLRMPGNQGKIGYFMSANDVKFRKPVLPGDMLFIEAEILRVKRSIGQARCRCTVNGETVSEGELMFSLMDR